jgi:hypothetical protein
VTLFIGNDNPKGGAAIRSLVKTLGKPIRAPQGVITCFGGREVVPLPRPIGPRSGFNVESPDYDVFPPLFGVGSLTVKVVFELRPTTWFFAVLAALGRNYGEATARWLGWIGERFRRGSSAGVVMTELFYADGGSRRAVLFARRDGQRMAALPCALVAQSLCDAGNAPSGVMTAYTLLGAARMLEEIQRCGFELQCT